MLRTQPDKRLLALAQAGSRPAFEELVRRHRGGLFTFASHLVSPSRADDVVQDSTLKAYTALERGDQVEHPRAWLYGIVRNTGLNHLRGERWHEQIDENYDGVEQPHEAFERRQQVADLVTGLGELPDAQRAAIVQRELEGKGHDEIAGSLGVSAGAVRQLIYRARNTLRTAAGAMIPLHALRYLILSGGAEPISGAAGAAGAGFGLSAAKLGVGALLATSAVVGGAEVGKEIKNPQGDSQAVAAETASAAPRSSSESSVGSPTKVRSRKESKSDTRKQRRAAHEEHPGDHRPPPDDGHYAHQGDGHHGGGGAPPPGGQDGGGHPPGDGSGTPPPTGSTQPPPGGTPPPPAP